MPWGEWIQPDTTYETDGNVGQPYHWSFHRPDWTGATVAYIYVPDVPTVYPARVSNALNIDSATNEIVPEVEYGDFFQFRSMVQTDYTWATEEHLPGGSTDSRRVAVDYFGAQHAVSLVPFPPDPFEGHLPYPSDWPEGATDYEYEDGNGEPISASIQITYEYVSTEIETSHQWRAAEFSHADLVAGGVSYSPSGTTLWSSGALPQGDGVTSPIDVSSILNSDGTFVIKSSSDLTSIDPLPAYFSGGSDSQLSRCVWLGFDAEWVFHTPRYRFWYDELPEPEIIPVTVVRQYPRDDQYGLGSAPRIHPPPMRSRFHPGLQ